MSVAFPKRKIKPVEAPGAIVCVVALLFLIMVLSTEFIVVPLRVYVPHAVPELLLIVLAVVSEAPK